MVELNALYELAQEFIDTLAEVYAEHSTSPDVEPIPFVDSQFIMVGSAGSMPAYKQCGQLTSYIGLPYSGLLNQGDAVTCGTPVSAGFTLELLRCSPQPPTSTKGFMITQKFRDQLELSEKHQANDVLLMRETALRFLDTNGASTNQKNNANVSVGQIEGLYKAITVSVTIPLLKKNRELHIG